MFAYNVKIIEYPNGDVQLRHYSAPIVPKEIEMYEKDMTMLYESDTDPFAFSKFKEVDEFDHIISSQEENEKRIFNRTKNKVF